MIRKILSVVLLLTLSLSITSFALDFRSADNITIAKGTVINDNLFVAGKTVIVSGLINGNLFTCGSNVIVDGRVTGTIFASGGDLYLSGQAKNIVAGGGKINVDCIINQDLLVGGGQVYLGKGSRVGRDAALGCGGTTLAGTIGRTLSIGSGKLTLLPSTIVKGRFNYSAQTANISDQAKIAGKINVIAQPEVAKTPAQSLAGFSSAFKIISFLAILLLGILIIIFMPNQVEMITAKMTNQCWKSLGWGILALLVIPLAVILLMVTLIGFPLGAMLLFSYSVLIYVAAIFVSLVIGKWVLAKIGKANFSLIWALLIGLVVLKILAMIPILGGIAGFLMFLWALGEVNSTRHQTYLAAREARVL